LVLNRVEDFEASRADVFVGQGVTDTLLLGDQGTVEDHGLNTVLVPLSGKARASDDN
jgi:hypothetical protein